MFDRDASSGMERAAEGAQGAQTEWFGMLQNLAEQIQKQQQNSQQMTQELMNTYMQLLNTPGSYISGQTEQQQQTVQQTIQQWMEQAQQQQQTFQLLHRCRGPSCPTRLHTSGQFRTRERRSP